MNNKEVKSHTNNTLLDKSSLRNSLSNTGLSNLSQFNSGDYSSNPFSNLNSTLNYNTIKKNIPLPSKPPCYNNKTNTSISMDKKFNSKSTKNNGN